MFKKHRPSQAQIAKARSQSYHLQNCPVFKCDRCDDIVFALARLRTHRDESE